MTLLNRLLDERREEAVGIYWLLQVNLGLESVGLSGKDVTLSDAIQVYHLIKNEDVSPQDLLSLEEVDSWLSMHMILFDKVLDYLASNQSSVFEDSFLTQQMDFITRTYPLDMYEVTQSESVVRLKSSTKTILNQLEVPLQAYLNQDKKGLPAIVSLHQALAKAFTNQSRLTCFSRLLVFGECLRLDITPPIIPRQYHDLYNKALRNDARESQDLLDLFIQGQAMTKALLVQMNIKD